MNRRDALDLVDRFYRSIEEMRLVHERFQLHPRGPRRGSHEWDDYWKTFDKTHLPPEISEAEVREFAQFANLADPNTQHSLSLILENTVSREENIRITRQKLAEAEAIEPHDASSGLAN